MHSISIVLVTKQNKFAFVIYFSLQSKPAWSISRKWWGYLKAFIAVLFFVIWSCCWM